MTDQPETPPNDAPAPLPEGILSRYPWLTFCLPLIVFMAIGSLEPAPPVEEGSESGGLFSFISLPYSAYPIVYTVKIALTVAALVFVWPGLRTFPLKISPAAVGLGVVGAAVWIALAEWKPEAGVLQSLGLGWLTGEGVRSGFNPLAELADQPAWAYAFLAIRFIGLAAVIPIAEEFFLRGFLMRFFVAEDWYRQPIGKVNSMAIAVGTIVPMLMHPGELLAAAVWFSGVTWWMVRSGRIWDCVVIHAVTNLLLGVYVVASGAWHLM